VTRPPAFTAASDPRRDLPPTPGARLDGARAALASLREEERRLARLGLTGALRRCREQLRYWEFLAALFALQGAPAPRLRDVRRSH
jgi:hypothetical protein